MYAKVENASPLELLQNAVVSNLQYQVSSSIRGLTIEVFDYSGRITYKTSVKSGVQHINVSSWSAGEYVIRLLTLEGQVYSQRFIKH
ncbi:MAG: T9SS type A sorting domain-containing protein [Methylotenera sp.]